MVIGHDDLQPLAHAQHVLVLAAPLQRVAGGQRHLLRHQLLCLLDVAADVSPREIHVHVAGEHAVLVADHGRAGGHADVGELRQRHLRARHRRDEDALQRVQAVALLAGVAHVDGVPFPPLDRGGDRFAADGGLDHHLGLLDGQPVARELVAAQGEVEEEAAGRALGVDAARARHVAEHRLDLRADAFDHRQVGPVDLDPDRRPHPGGEHVDARLDRHRPRVGHARETAASDRARR